MFFSGQVTVGQALRKLALAVTATVALAGAAQLPAQARSESSAGGPVVATVDLSALPPQARQTHELILAGGPFPYGKDGSVFGNRERLLPLNTRGYYREYTVKTPGARDRGARRIVAGGGASGDARTSGEYYYTDDHYRSFRNFWV